ncbi:MAG: hypothetical protein PWR20_2517 [Bacteroidales bacterium]|jgi:hypothetical protein|nr:hypothetical protein [Bacteroidales bacterium]MDN5328742.1 hypothetical protein [Bacteroidales bacterium]NLH51456.1 hypothetical protein [Bacteroidales bacterium]NPV36382.1 hypothetical protein [Bacteroidales bacterium]
MRTFLINFAAVIAGIILGSLVNMGLVWIGPHIIPPPAGLDMTTEEGLKQAIPLLKPVHFLMPFLAHAIGTLAGAILTALLAKKPLKPIAPLLIGVFFMIGGILNILILPSPLWFSMTDLVIAYLPMAWLGFYLVKKMRKPETITE